MFTLKEHNTFEWPVSVKMPGANGEQVTAQFLATFNLMRLDKVREIQQKASAEGGDSDAATIRAVLIGWDNVRDEAGNMVPFSDEALELMTQLPPVKLAILKAYFGAITGGVAQAKN